MNAAEIMTKRVITVRPDTSVGEIADPYPATKSARFR